MATTGSLVPVRASRFRRVPAAVIVAPSGSGPARQSLEPPWREACALAALPFGPEATMDLVPCIVATLLAQAAPPPPPPARQDASKAEIALPAGNGWNAQLVLDHDVGVWTCGVVDAFEMNGALEAFGLDDKGRCILLSSYSGKWTPWPTVQDHEWLGAFAHAEIDPRRPEREIYVGGKRGNLYQIVVHKDGTLDTARIAAFPAEELHTAIAGDLDPQHAGDELLFFTHLGNVYEPRARAGGFEFDVAKRAELAGRVRQALVLPQPPGTPAGVAPWIAGVCRTGEVLLMRCKGAGLEVRELLHEEMGFGRIARRRQAPGAPEVLYVTRDDGLILRLEARGAIEGEWKREPIYAGPQGPRGIAAGRFDADSAVETLAVFGYSKRVELLSRRPGEPSFQVETIFVERDKGHWLETVEVDGRNATDELMGSGYGARIFILARPPGTGLQGVAPDPRPENGAGEGSREQPRVRDELAQIVQHSGFAGTVALFDSASGEWSASDLDGARRRRLPASTFKIANALLALELATVEGADAVIPWDGIVRERVETNRDLDLKTAFRISSVPHFVELARRAGRERIGTFLERSAYGNADVGGASETFWLDGELRISPLEQLDFLIALERGALPASPRAQAATRELLVLERGGGHVLRAKSGWARPPEGDVGWWVGWLERGERRVFFATCLEARRRDAALGPAREAVTRAVLQAIDALPEPDAVGQ